MSFGQGRPAKSPNYGEATPLSAEEILAFVPQPNLNKVTVLRDRHHMVARLCALGLPNYEVATRTSYSEVRISTLKADPTFQELIEYYRGQVNEQFREATLDYFEVANANRNLAAVRLNDMLNDDGHEFTPSQLLAIQADAADRTGYPKRKEALNINVDFAARLDQAIRRSSQARLPAPSPSGIGAGEPETIELRPLASAPPLRRRA